MCNCKGKLVNCSFTDIDRRILRLISQGHTPKSAALRLGIAEEEIAEDNLANESVLELEINANSTVTENETDQQFDTE
jgi:GH24 family phage-related lysozyme (muramidase)